MAVSTLEHLINPEVYADYVESKFVDAIRFAPLATIDNDLENVAGDTLYLPAFSYIGDASRLAEGSTLTPASLVASKVSVTVYKIANGVTLTDEAILSAKGDVVGEGADQIVLSMASQTDNEMLAVLNGITGNMLYETSSSTTAPVAADILAALELFGEDVDGLKAVVVPPAVYTEMRVNYPTWIPASEIAADIALKGIVGEFGGCQVFVSNKLKTSGSCFIVKPGALHLLIKRDTVVEADRDILNFTTTITASKHMAAYLYNASGAIKIAKKSA